MAPRIGFEPITKWLTATYSTIELPRNILVGVARLELARLSLRAPNATRFHLRNYTPKFWKFGTHSRLIPSKLST